MNNTDEKFDFALSILLCHEGGESNNKNDHGGLTKYGITLGFLKTNNIDINKDDKIDAQDIHDLTINEARLIYFTYFWSRFHYNEIEDKCVAAKILDMAVNMGAFTAHKLVQRSINAMIKKPIKEDGMMGSETLKAINDLPEKYLMQELCHVQKDFYLSIVEHDPTQRVFLEGWLKRAAWA